MVTAEIADMLMGNRIYMTLAGVGLIALGLNGFMNPNTWAFATGALGQIFNLLPDAVHQVLGLGFVLGGATQVGDSTGLY